MMCVVRRILSLLSGLVVLVLAGLALAGGVAVAEPPARSADRVTDRAGVLDATGRARVTDALNRLHTDTGYDLFVVYVRTFDGQTGQEWADESARLSQLGSEDVLLAVAVDDRAYGMSVADGFPVAEPTLDRVRSREVEPRLSAGDWAGAAVAAAEGLGGKGGGSDGWLPVGALVGGVGVFAGGAYLVSRRRRRAGAADPTAKPDPASEPEPAGPGAAPAADPFPGVSTDDLAGRAGKALIDVDDAVRTSEQELTAARAHFGDEAVACFVAALDRSRAEMMAAFEINQQLDDDADAQAADRSGARGTAQHGLDEVTRRGMWAEVLRLAGSADARLDSEVEEFDRLRGLEADAPGYVEGLARRQAAVSGRLPAAEADWVAAGGRFAATALEPVADNLGHARALLAEAGTEIAEARGEVAGAAPAHAVVSGRAAEDALTEAETLLDGIGRRVAELDEAARRVPSARAEVAQDLAEARALPEVDAGAVARADAALASADDAVHATPPDPMAALRLLDEAGAALDAAIAEARAAGDRARRAAAALEQALLTAGASVSAAEDFVATRRGAIGAAARTRLAEARRHLAAAGGGVGPAAGGGAGPVAGGGTGPDGSGGTTELEARLESARQAQGYADEALRLAREDVSGWSGQSGFGGGGTRGGSGGGIAAELGGMVLGGILSGAMREAGRGGGYGGGFGGGPGAGSGGVPGSFGGSATRGRRGGGGRF